jgi:hypothetical protein
MALVVSAGVIRHGFWGHQRQPASPEDRIRQKLSPAGSSIQRMGIPQMTTYEITRAATGCDPTRCERAVTYPPRR